MNSKSKINRNFLALFQRIGNLTNHRAVYIHAMNWRPLKRKIKQQFLERLRTIRSFPWTDNSTVRFIRSVLFMPKLTFYLNFSFASNIISTQWKQNKNLSFWKIFTFWSIKIDLRVSFTKKAKRSSSGITLRDDSTTVLFQSHFIIF